MLFVGLFAAHGTGVGTAVPGINHHADCFLFAGGVLFHGFVLGGLRCLPGCAFCLRDLSGLSFGKVHAETREGTAGKDGTAHALLHLRDDTHSVGLILPAAYVRDKAVRDNAPDIAREFLGEFHALNIDEVAHGVAAAQHMRADF